MAAANGDAHAIQTLILSVTPAMLRAVRSVLGACHPEVEDVLQESAIGLVNALGAFRRECTLLHFACRIAVLAALSARRRIRARGEEVPDLDEVPHADDDRSPIDLLLASRRRAILRELCDALPAPQGEALVLHCALGFTVEEVADATQVPPNTVKSRLRLGKEALRDRIVADPAMREALETVR